MMRMRCLGVDATAVMQDETGEVRFERDDVSLKTSLPSTRYETAARYARGQSCASAS